MDKNAPPAVTPREFAERLRADPDFRAEVEADPKSAVAALGVEIPPHIDDVRIVENTGDTLHLVLPPGPDGVLSDDDLSGVSGGAAGDRLVVTGGVPLSPLASMMAPPLVGLGFLFGSG